jgi:ABC-2 type transport system permease protein
MHPLVLLLAHHSGRHWIGHVLVGVLVTIGLAIASPAQGSALMILVLAPIGALIVGAVFIAIMSLAFVVRGLGGAVLSVPQQLSEYSRYPLSIYPSWLSLILVTVFPFAFAAAIPAEGLIVHDYFLILATPVVALAAVTIAVILWSRLLLRYVPAGS